MPSPEPGEVYLYDGGFAGKTRPVGVVSRADPDAPRALCVVAPCTTADRGSRYEAAIEKPRWLREPCVVNVQGVQAVRHDQLGRFLGRLPPAELEKVRASLRYLFDF
jgi:mRNA interferase MazF